MTPEELVQLIDQIATQIINQGINSVRDDERGNLLQEIRLGVLLSVSNLRDQEALREFIRRIAQRRVFDYYRKSRQQRERHVSIDDVEQAQCILDALSTNETPEEEAVRREAIEIMRDFIDTLSWRDRAIVILRYGVGLSVAQIADVLGITRQYADRLLKRIIKAGKRYLEQCCQDDTGSQTENP